MELALIKIDNPQQQAVGIQVALEVLVDGRTLRYELGLAAPFPAEQPGVFLMAVPKDAQARIATAAQEAAAILTLAPITAQEALKPGVMVVAEIRRSR